MNAAELLELVRLRGVVAWAEGDRLVLRPASRLSPELIETLRSHKPELLAALRAEQQPAAERVGPWQPPGTDRRCLSCGAGLQPGDTDDGVSFTCRWPGMPTRIQ